MKNTIYEAPYHVIFSILWMTTRSTYFIYMHQLSVLWLEWLISGLLPERSRICPGKIHVSIPRVSLVKTRLFYCQSVLTELTLGIFSENTSGWLQKKKSCDIWGGRNVTLTGFSPSIPLFPYQYHATNAPSSTNPGAALMENCFGCRGAMDT